MKCLLLLIAGLVVAESTTMMLQNSTADDDCDDEADRDCWSRPDKDCFGIYEPWAHVHCPLRCGFCPGKFPPCEDKLEYCDQFDTDTCTSEAYRLWARTNCRKHCNLCAVPTRPPPTGVSTSPDDDNNSTTVATVPNAPNVTDAVPTGMPHDVPGTVARGRSNTIIIEAPGTDQPGVCLYHGQLHKQGERWNEGCDYDCVCMDSTKNRVLCEEKCTHWELTSGLTGCKLVKEDRECCMRLECS